MMSNNRFTNPLGLAAVMQAGRRRTVEALVVFVMLFALALPGLAQDQGGTAKSKGILPVPDYSGDLRSRSYLTGDWGGVRSEWADKGFQATTITVELYGGETAETVVAVVEPVAETASAAPVSRELVAEVEAF